MIRRLALVLATLLAAPAPAQIHHRIYPAPKAALTINGLPAGTALIHVTTTDRLTLTGLERAPDGDRPVLLLLHGNGSSAVDMLEWLTPLATRGYGIVAAEYREYSGNPGKASEAGLAADADAFYARAKALAGARPVIVVGHSLGGGVAFGLAARNRLAALVTIGTFTRPRAVAPRLARAFIADRYDNLALSPTLDEPLFLIHGTADETIWAGYGKELGQAAANAGKDGVAYFVTGADHHPDGAVIAAIVDDVAARIAGRPTAPLPPGLQVFGFGRFK